MEIKNGEMTNLLKELRAIENSLDSLDGIGLTRLAETLAKINIVRNDLETYELLIKDHLREKLPIGETYFFPDIKKKVQKFNGRKITHIDPHDLYGFAKKNNILDRFLGCVKVVESKIDEPNASDQRLTKYALEIKKEIGKADPYVQVSKMSKSDLTKAKK